VEKISARNGNEMFSFETDAPSGDDDAGHYQLRAGLSKQLRTIREPPEQNDFTQL
jgi:hypothetical protein